MKRIKLPLLRNLFKPPTQPARDDKVIIEGSAYIAPGSVFESRTDIGLGARINGPITVRGSGRLIIGRYAAIGANITVITSNHKTTYANLQIALQSKIGAVSIAGPAKTVVIGHNSWVGDRVVFTPSGSIGVGCVVGAGTVVTKQFPPFSVVVGNPARFLRKRFHEKICDTLLELEWWNWDIATMRKNKAFFSADLSSLSSADELLELINK